MPLGACDEPNKEPGIVITDKKVGVLIVNHGSKSKLWRSMLEQVQVDVEDSLLAIPNVQMVKTAFMAYNEPSIASQMKLFDKEGFDEVIVIPLFLTISSHYSHDIPVMTQMWGNYKTDYKSMQKKQTTFYSFKYSKKICCYD